MGTEADKERFLLIIRQNIKLIFKVCNSYCKNTEDRKDLVQEVIIQLWQSFDKYNETFKLSTWMYRIALNTAISHYRSDKHRQENTMTLHDSLIDIVDENMEAELDNNVKRLYLFIDQLNELNRALMILYLDNNSYKEIADVLGISESNVATKIARVKQHLKQQFLKTTL